MKSEAIVSNPLFAPFIHFLSSKPNEDYGDNDQILTSSNKWNEHETSTRKAVSIVCTSSWDMCLEEMMTPSFPTAVLPFKSLANFIHPSVVRVLRGNLMLQNGLYLRASFSTAFATQLAEASSMPENQRSIWNNFSGKSGRHSTAIPPVMWISYLWDRLSIPCLLVFCIKAIIMDWGQPRPKSTIMIFRSSNPAFQSTLSKVGSTHGSTGAWESTTNLSLFSRGYDVRVCDFDFIVLFKFIFSLKRQTF